MVGDKLRVEGESTTSRTPTPRPLRQPLSYNNNNNNVNNNMVGSKLWVGESPRRELPPPLQRVRPATPLTFGLSPAGETSAAAGCSETTTVVALASLGGTVSY